MAGPTTQTTRVPVSESPVPSPSWPAARLAEGEGADRDEGCCRRHSPPSRQADRGEGAESEEGIPLDPAPFAVCPSVLPSLPTFPHYLLSLLRASNPTITDRCLLW